MPLLPVWMRRGVFRSTRHTVAVDGKQAGDRELVRLLDEQAALRRVATLVARATDRLGVFAAVADSRKQNSKHPSLARRLQRGCRSGDGVGQRATALEEVDPTRQCRPEGG